MNTGHPHGLTLTPTSPHYQHLSASASCNDTFVSFWINAKSKAAYCVISHPVPSDHKFLQRYTNQHLHLHYYRETTPFNSALSVFVRYISTICTLGQTCSAVGQLHWVPQVAQLSKRDCAAEWVSFCHKWKTGTGWQYFADIIGISSSTTVT